MPEATLTSKGQITIPKPVRDHLRLESGDRVDFLVTETGDVILRPARRSIRELRGLLRRPGRAMSLDEMDAGIRRKMTEKYGRKSSG
jgi:antitoxin PrlF